MAAHDEKISQNRRRLFKALSTAPVVATLSPGSALATGSVLQCLSDTAEPENFRTAVDLCAAGDPDCYAYRSVQYWDGGDVTVITPSTTSAPWPPGVSSLAQPGVIIVQSSTSPGTFYTRVDNISSDVIVLGTDVRLEVLADASGDRLVIIQDVVSGGNTTSTELVSFQTKTGAGLILVQPVDKNGSPTSVGSASNPPTSVVDTQLLLPDAHQAPGLPGDLKGLAATCLTSVNQNGSVVQNFVLSKG